ncbi:sigma-70 family RNA polymerase sigma factor [bacterium]|nr:sigma-70 family RNA polymerase sigma factor [bacterium]
MHDKRDTTGPNVRLDYGKQVLCDRWKDLSPAEIIETFRFYLLSAANKAVGSELRVKAAPSDLVQETIIVAIKDFDNFRGTSERELFAWLTTILGNRLADAARQFRRQRNDITRETPLDRSACDNINLTLCSADGTPSAYVMAREEDQRVRSALSKLSPEDQAIIGMRNWDLLTFEQIGQKIGLSESGARKRWAAAMKELRTRLQA